MTYADGSDRGHDGGELGGRYLSNRLFQLSWPSLGRGHGIRPVDIWGQSKLYTQQHRKRVSGKGMVVYETVYDESTLANMVAYIFRASRVPDLRYQVYKARWFIQFGDARSKRADW